MGMKNMREFKRYDAFIPSTVFVPAAWGGGRVEVSGWIKDISQHGIALESYIFAPAEIDQLATNGRVIALIRLPDNSAINGMCEIAWVNFSPKRKYCTMGLKILTIDALQRDRWESFVEHLFSYQCRA